MPFFVVRDSRHSDGEFASRTVGVDNHPFETYEEAYTTAEKLYPGIEFSIIEAETPREALSRVSGVEIPPYPEG